MDEDGSMADLVARRSKSQRSKTGSFALVLVGLACVVVGCVLGSILFGGSAAVFSLRSDGAVASFSYSGETREITQKDLQKLSIGHSLQEDESFDYTDVLYAVRMGVLSQEARNQGISVTDEDVSAYAKSQYRTDDYGTLGEGVLDDEAVKEALEQELLVDRLRGGHISDDSVQQPPVTPAPLAGGPGAESIPSAEYGAYIVELFGEAYDAKTNTWVQLDSPFYEAFQDESFSAQEATFEQAMKAYYVAYSLYDTAAFGSENSWTGYVNEVMSDVEVVLHGITM
ncbi:hypothetical protein [Eggerthella guodeyinii]|uniref:Uncharacterized protein n=1 Tax=Eggerthella guodeyinii TaxID=2690837 RepID=A0A6N7RLC5_9ACTN|nr:hypothetical protein [Eggerthella guodeyinii]MRX81640.1 hypothetical protein [Eggerthella guodeyinii]